MSTVQPSVTIACDPELAGRRLLILGGGLWQREYVRHSRALGAEVWLTDWSADAVARPDADHFDAIDLRDREATLAFARDARVEAVLTAADVGVPTAAYVAEALGLPGVSPVLAEQATNKWAMRRRAREIGLGCPWFEHVTTVAAAMDAGRDRSFPMIVKPVDNCSSRGVQVVQRQEELSVAVEGALHASAVGEALVEQFLDGREGSIEAIVQDGDLFVLGVCDKTKSRLPDRFDLELRYPGAYPASTSQRLEHFTTTLIRGFGIQNAVLHIEFLLTGAEDEIFLIEFALRGCGSKVVTHLLPAMTGRDIVGAVVRQAFGLRSELRPVQARHGVLHFLMFPPGQVQSVHGVDAASRISGVVDLTIEPGPGDRIEEVHDGRSRPGHLLVVGDTRGDAQDVVHQVRDLVRLDYADGTAAGPIPLLPVAAR
jgi:biotin carboxylase